MLNRASLLSAYYQSLRFFTERIIVFHFIAILLPASTRLAEMLWPDRAREPDDTLLAFSSCHIPPTMDFYFIIFPFVESFSHSRSGHRKEVVDCSRQRLQDFHANFTPLVEWKIRKFWKKINNNIRVYMHSTSDLADKHCTNKTDYPKWSILCCAAVARFSVWCGFCVGLFSLLLSSTHSGGAIAFPFTVFTATDFTTTAASQPSHSLAVWRRASRYPLSAYSYLALSQHNHIRFCAEVLSAAFVES